MSSVTDQVPHRDYPERSVYNTLHFCEFCDCCYTIPYTSVSSVTHPVPYRDYPPVLLQIQYPTEITRTLQNLSLEDSVCLTPVAKERLGQLVCRSQDGTGCSSACSEPSVLAAAFELAACSSGEPAAAWVMGRGLTCCFELLLRGMSRRSSRRNIKNSKWHRCSFSHRIQAEKQENPESMEILQRRSSRYRANNPRLH